MSLDRAGLILLSDNPRTTQASHADGVLHTVSAALTATYLSPEVIQMTTPMTVAEAVVALMGDFFLFAMDQGISASTLAAAVGQQLQEELDFRTNLP